MILADTKNWIDGKKKLNQQVRSEKLGQKNIFDNCHFTILIFKREKEILF